MNRINICLLLFLTIFTSSAICPTEPDNICAEINSIDPDAPESDYLSLMQRMKNKGESVCSCIQKNIAKRIDESKQALEQKWGITQTYWNDIDAFVAKIAAQDAQEGPIKIESEFEIPDHFKQEIKDCFYHSGYRNGTIKIKAKEVTLVNDNGESSPVPNPADVRRSFKFKDAIDLENRTLTLEKVGVKKYILTLYAPFFENPEIRLATLLHELQHVTHLDMVRGTALTTVATRADDSLLHNPEKFSDSEEFMAFSRAFEARADQFPAACSNSSCAQEIENLGKFLVKTSSNDDGDYLNDAPAQRLSMATRIRKLKQAEEQLNKE